MITEHRKMSPNVYPVKEGKRGRKKCNQTKSFRRFPKDKINFNKIIERDFYLWHIALDYDTMKVTGKQ